MAPQYLKRLSAYADTAVERKRAEPANDILSVIVHAQLDDGLAAAPQQPGIARVLQPALSGGR